MSLQTLASGIKQCEDFMLFQVSRDKYLVFALYLLGNFFRDNFLLCCETKQNFLVQGRKSREGWAGLAIFHTGFGR